MMQLTRGLALGQARADLGQYMLRVLRDGLVDEEYAFGLARLWDRRLAGLARLGPELPVADDVAKSLMLLSRELRVDDLDPDVAVRWLDVYPDSVADLFPPSAVTFRLVDDEEADADASTAQTRRQISAAA
jgi:hypothetical protein